MQWVSTVSASLYLHPKSLWFTSSTPRRTLSHPISSHLVWFGLVLSWLVSPRLDCWSYYSRFLVFISSKLDEMERMIRVRMLHRLGAYKHPLTDSTASDWMITSVSSFTYILFYVHTHTWTKYQMRWIDGMPMQALTDWFKQIKGLHVNPFDNALDSGLNKTNGILLLLVQLYTTCFNHLLIQSAD